MATEVPFAYVGLGFRDIPDETHTPQFADKSCPNQVPCHLERWALVEAPRQDHFPLTLPPPHQIFERRDRRRKAGSCRLEAGVSLQRQPQPVFKLDGGHEIELVA